MDARTKKGFMGISVIFTAWLLGSGAWAADFHVGQRGDDANPGTRQKPWKSLERANRQDFRPGDLLLLAGGESFVGNLRLDAKDAGSQENPVVVGSYGPGRATIQAGLGYAVLIENAGGIEVRDLVCVGEDRRRNQGAGVAFINTLSGNVRLKHVRIRNIEARGFGRELPPRRKYVEGYQLPQGAGILVGGNAVDKSKSGYEDVEITGCTAYDNAYYGILITGSWDAKATRYANAKVRIADCLVYKNPGDPLYHENHSGSGILVEDCDGGLVERCVAYENGALCDDAPGGPCGIWTAIANRVTIQHCESYRNRTGTAADGDGFDLDGGCTSCILQYNYAHDNDGAGILVYTYDGAPQRDHGNIVRWNVCQNNATKRRQYGELMAGNDGDGMSGVEIYQNTFITNQPAEGVVAVHGKDMGVAFRNNLFLASSAIPMVRIDQDNQALVFQGNLYWGPGSPLAWLKGRTLDTLLDWRKLGMEMFEGLLVGMAADPRLPLHAGRGVAGDLMRLKSLPAFRPAAGFEVMGGAVDLRRLQLDPGPVDFSGRPLPARPFAGALIPGE